MAGCRRGSPSASRTIARNALKAEAARQGHLVTSFSVTVVTVGSAGKPALVYFTLGPSVRATASESGGARRPAADVHVSLRVRLKWHQRHRPIALLLPPFWSMISSLGVFLALISKKKNQQNEYKKKKAAEMCFYFLTLSYHT